MFRIPDQPFVIGYADIYIKVFNGGVVRTSGVLTLVGNLVSRIGDVALCELLEEVELSNDWLVLGLIVEGSFWNILKEYHTRLRWRWVWNHPSREVHVLKYLINKVRYQKIDLPAGEELNVDTGVVVEGPLIFNFNLGSNIFDRLVNCWIDWGGKDSVIHIDEEDYFTLV